MRHARVLQVVIGIVAAAGALTATLALASRRMVPDDPDYVAPPMPAPEAALRAVADLDPPVSSAPPGEAPKVVALVLISRSALSIAGDPRPIVKSPMASPAGAPPIQKSGPDGLFIHELGSALGFAAQQSPKQDPWAPGPSLGVIADASTSYRVLRELLFTATASGMGAVELARRSGAGLAWQAMTLAPSLCTLGSPRCDDRSLELEVHAGHEGISVRTLHGNVAPGCLYIGPGVALPSPPRAYDYAGLTACLSRVKKLPGSPMISGGYLAADPDIDLGTLLSILDAARSTAENEPLFPDLSLRVEPAPPRDTRIPTQGRLILPSARDEGRPPPTAGTSTGPVPNGIASIGGAAVAGSAIKDASRVVAGMQAGFRRCYRKGLAESPTMHGSMRITAQIGPNGEVLAVTESHTGILSGLVATCVQNRVSAAQFHPPEGGGATVTIPVTFKIP